MHETHFTYSNPENLDVGDLVKLARFETLSGTVTKKYPSGLLAVQLNCEVLLTPTELNRVEQEL